MNIIPKNKIAAVVEFIGSKYLLILILLPLLFIGCGFFEDGINVDSTTYSVIARNMAETGNWFAPGYTAYFASRFAEHPPLIMWVHGLIFLLFGAGDPTSRIFGASCTIGCIVIVYLIGKTVKNREYGFLAGAVLLLTYNFIQIGNSAMLDAPVTFFSLLGLYSMVKMYDDICDYKWFVLLGLALGLSFLAKGVVAAPLWLAVVFTALFYKRRWLKSGRFYVAVGIGLGIIAAYLTMDHIYADGYFVHHYFGTQIFRSLTATNTVQKAQWYSYFVKFVRLYLPFIILLPFGIYISVKNKINSLYPIIFALLAFIIFHSASGKLMYHYLVPAYALSAPLVALPLSVWLKESIVQKSAVGLALIWLTGVIIIAAVDIKIHPIRSPEIYNLTETMTAYLDQQQSRDGLIIARGTPNWDHFAKTSWYWRSNVKKVVDFDQAVEQLRNNDSFVYILTDSRNKKSDKELQQLQLNKLTGNDKIEIYIP